MALKKKCTLLAIITLNITLSSIVAVVVNFSVKPFSSVQLFQHFVFQH